MVERVVVSDEMGNKLGFRRDATEIKFKSETTGSVINSRTGRMSESGICRYLWIELTET